MNPPGWLVLLILVAALALPARAQGASGLDMVVDSCLGGYYRPGLPLPVTVILENRGPAFQGKLRARGQQHPFPVAEADVSLPTGSRQRYELLLPDFPGYGGALLVQLMSGRRLVREVTRDLTPIHQANQLLVLVLAPPDKDFSSVAALDPPPQKVTPAPELVPGQWESLRAADLIIVHDFPALGLAAEAQTALADWTRAGGNLVLVSNLDPGEYSGSPLAALLPLDPRGTLAVGGLTFLTGPASGGRTLIEKGGVPLLVSAYRGRGVACLVTTDVSSSDLLGEKATRDLWRQVSAEGQRALSRWPNLDPNLSLLTRIPEIRPPDFSLFGWFLVAYVVLTGPVNYWILRRRDRMLGIFLTVPALALAFTGGAFLSGWLVRGNQVMLLEAGYLTLSSGQATAVLNERLALYSPYASTYRLTFPLDTAVQEDVSYGSGEPLVQRLTQKVELDEVRLPMWAMRRFRLLRPRLLPGPLTLSVRRSGGRVHLRADNDTGLSLESCRLLYGGQASTPFALPPGPSDLELSLEKQRVLTPADLDGSLAQDARNLAATIPSSDGPLLFGWCRQPLSEAQVQGLEPVRRALIGVFVRP